MKKILFLLVVIMSLTFVFVDCDGDQASEVPYTEYPGTEYLLSNDVYDWRLQQDFGHILVINSYDELKNHIPSADGNYPDVDFSKSTILLAIGGSAPLARPLEKKMLKVSENEYHLNIVLEETEATAYEFWVVVIITNKLSNNSSVILNVEKR